MDPVLLPLLFIGSGALIAGVSVPLWLGKVAPNRFYGFRTPRLVHDERAWYPINRVAGRDLTVAGVAMALGGVAAGAAGVDLVEGPLMPLMLAAPMLLAVVHSFYFASTFVYALDHEAAPDGDERPVGSTTKQEAAPRRGRERDRS